MGREDPLEEENGNPTQYSCLENSMDRGAWWPRVHGVAKNQTQLSTTPYTCVCISVYMCVCVCVCVYIAQRLKIVLPFDFQEIKKKEKKEIRLSTQSNRK